MISLWDEEIFCSLFCWFYGRRTQLPAAYTIYANFIACQRGIGVGYSAYGRPTWHRRRIFSRNSNKMRHQMWLQRPNTTTKCENSGRMQVILAEIDCLKRERERDKMATEGYEDMMEANGRKRPLDSESEHSITKRASHGHGGFTLGLCGLKAGPAWH